MLRRTLIASLIVTGLLSHRALVAQPRCTPADTPRACVMRWIPGPIGTATPSSSAVAPAAEAVQTTVASFSGGLASVDAPIHTALRDLLTVLSGSLDSSTLGDDGTALTFGYNLPGTILGARRQLRLEASFRRAQLSAATTAVLPSSAAAELDRSLSSLDDVTAGLSFHPSTRRFGRILDPHRALFTDVYLAALQGAGGDPESYVLQAVESAGIAAVHADEPIRDLAPDAAEQRALIARMEGVAASAFPAAPATVTNDFATLLSNQPQLYASVVHHHRRDVVGPGEWGVNVTWEIGTQNLNAFYRTEGRECAETSANCAGAFASHLQRIERARIAHRLALSIEYRATAETTVSPGAFAPYVLPATRNLVYSAVYGRPFASMITGKEGWIDLSFEYDGTRHTGSVATTGGILSAQKVVELPTLIVPPPRDRGAAAMSYTQKISDRLSFPVSLVYAERTDYLPGRPSPVSNRPEPVARSAEELTVHLGVVYRITPGRGPARCACCC